MNSDTENYAPAIFVNGLKYAMESRSELKKFYFAYDVGYDKSKLVSRERDVLPSDWNSSICSFIQTISKLPDTFFAQLQSLFRLPTEQVTQFWEHGRIEFNLAAAHYAERCEKKREALEKEALEAAQRRQSKENEAATLLDHLKASTGSSSIAEDSEGEPGCDAFALLVQESEEKNREALLTTQSEIRAFVKKRFEHNKQSKSISLPHRTNHQ